MRSMAGVSSDSKRLAMALRTATNVAFHDANLSLKMYLRPVACTFKKKKEVGERTRENDKEVEVRVLLKEERGRLVVTLCARL
jgi:hypothetical protein